MEFQYLILLILAIAFTIYNIKPVIGNVINPIYVQGIRLKVSLDEIFNKIIPSNKIDVIAILSASKNVIWSDSIQVHLSSEYYDVSEYILIIREPQEIDVGEMSIYEKIVKERFEYILKRRDVYLSLTNTKGDVLNATLAHSFELVIVLGVTFIILSIAVYAYFHMIKK